MTAAESITPAPAVASCLICAGPCSQLDAYRPMQLVRCLECGFAFQPARDAHDIRSLYDIDYFEQRRYSFDADQRKHEAQLRLRFIQTFAPGPGRLLEVGSSTGFFLSHARSAGWEVTGVEPCRAVAEWASEQHGTHVLAGFIEDIRLEPDAYDVVCGWHVLEHVANPLCVLEHLHDAVRPGGFIAFEVPNFGGIRSRRLAADWPHLAPSVHVGQFSPESIRALLSQAGFQTLAVRTVPTWAYTPPRDSLRPRQAARRLRYGIETRSTTFGSHPDKYDLLRAVGQRPR